MYDENLYNINLKDFSLEETDNINSFDWKNNEQNEKYIDKFRNSINNNQDTLYDIRFINEIIHNNSIIVMKQSKIIINYDGIAGGEGWL